MLASIALLYLSLHLDPPPPPNAASKHPQKPWDNSGKTAHGVLQQNIKKQIETWSVHQYHRSLTLSHEQGLLYTVNQTPSGGRLCVLSSFNFSSSDVIASFPVFSICHLIIRDEL